MGKLTITCYNWLLVLSIIKKISGNRKDDIPYMKWKIKYVPNHQTVFDTVIHITLVIWLVVEPPLWKILYSQLGWFFPIYGTIKHVPNHQTVFDTVTHSTLVIYLHVQPPVKDVRKAICLSWLNHMPYVNPSYSFILFFAEPPASVFVNQWFLQWFLQFPKSIVMQQNQVAAAPPVNCGTP